MPHDVFISYSQKDKAAADAICAGIEQHGFRCWIAPRDIPYGTDWGEGIVDAIGEISVFILVFTANANSSPQVKREVQIAFEREKVVIPFRLDATKPGKALEYYVTAIHWLDAFTEPLSQHIDKLAERLTALIGPRAAPAPRVSMSAAAIETPPAPEILPAPAAPEPEPVTEIAQPDESVIVEQIEAAAQHSPTPAATAAAVVHEANTEPAVLAVPASPPAEPADSSAASTPPPPAQADAGSVSDGLKDAAAQSPPTPIADDTTRPASPVPESPTMLQAMVLYISRPWPWIWRLTLLAALFSAMSNFGVDTRFGYIMDESPETAFLNVTIARWIFGLILLPLFAVSLIRLARSKAEPDVGRWGPRHGFISWLRLLALCAVVMAPIAMIDTSMVVIFSRDVEGDVYGIALIHSSMGWVYLICTLLNALLAAALSAAALVIGTLACRTGTHAVRDGLRARKRGGWTGFRSALAAMLGIGLGAVPPVLWFGFRIGVHDPTTAAIVNWIWMSFALCLVLPQFFLYGALLTRAERPAEESSRPIG